MFDGFEIPMYDESLMGVLCRGADRPEQAQTAIDRQPLHVTVDRDGAAVDELHHEIRRAFRCVPGVNHPSDVGMRQPREDVDFGREPCGSRRLGRRAANDLERDPLLILAVGAFGQIHRAHPSVTQQIDH